MVGWRLAQGSKWQAWVWGVLCGSAWALEFPVRLALFRDLVYSLRICINMAEAGELMRIRSAEVQFRVVF